MKNVILIVDDEEELRGVLKDTLSEDYNILEGADGLDGVLEVMLSDQHVDLIITDLNMPISDGLEMIKDLPREIPVIIISGYLHSKEFQAGLEKLNPVAVLKKPFDLSTLREHIHKVFEN